MTNATLKAAVNTKVYVGSWANTRVEKMKAKRDAGQGAIEYVGVIILMAIIVVALLQTDMGETVANKFKAQVNKIFERGA